MESSQMGCFSSSRALIPLLLAEVTPLIRRHGYPARIRGIVLLSVWMWVFTASAQPMLVTEHDWTFQIGNWRYGVFQLNIAPGNAARRTTVYCGGSLFAVSMRA